MSALERQRRVQAAIAAAAVHEDFEIL